MASYGFPVEHPIVFGTSVMLTWIARQFAQKGVPIDMIYKAFEIAHLSLEDTDPNMKRLRSQVGDLLCPLLRLTRSCLSEIQETHPHRDEDPPPVTMTLFYAWDVVMNVLSDQGHEQVSSTG